MGEHTNRLVESTSPYLLQHAHNPVNWYPWSKEALDLAKKKQVPILLSIGYSACHWCHVMEKESFENEQTAEIMNLPQDFDVRIYLVSWNGDSDNSDTFNVHIVFSRTDLPEFSSLIMPIASVLLVVGFNYRKKEFN